MIKSFCFFTSSHDEAKDDRICKEGEYVWEWTDCWNFSEESDSIIFVWTDKERKEYDEWEKFKIWLEKNTREFICWIRRETLQNDKQVLGMAEIDQLIEILIRKEIIIFFHFPPIVDDEVIRSAEEKWGKKIKLKIYSLAKSSPSAKKIKQIISANQEAMFKEAQSNCISFYFDLLKMIYSVQNSFLPLVIDLMGLREVVEGTIPLELEKSGEDKQGEEKTDIAIKYLTEICENKENDYYKILLNSLYNLFKGEKLFPEVDILDELEKEFDFDESIYDHIKNSSIFPEDKEKFIYNLENLINFEKEAKPVLYLFQHWDSLVSKRDNLNFSDVEKLLSRETSIPFGSLRKWMEKLINLLREIDNTINTTSG